LQQVNRIFNHIGRLLHLIFVFDSSVAEVSRIPPLSLPEDCYHPTFQLCIKGFFVFPVGDEVGYFYEVIYRLFDEHVPLSSMKNSYSSPWLTRQLAYLKNKKIDFLKISGLQTDFTKYSSAKGEFVPYNSDCFTSTSFSQ